MDINLRLILRYKLNTMRNSVSNMNRVTSKPHLSASSFIGHLLFLLLKRNYLSAQWSSRFSGSNRFRQCLKAMQAMILVHTVTFVKQQDLVRNSEGL